jgi:NIMA-interacting peptidyl-prolyl cis-trans isomerase 1
MQKEFEDAAFKLNKGEVSGIVDTASGLHLIQRLAAHT